MLGFKRKNLVDEGRVIPFVDDGDIAVSQVLIEEGGQSFVAVIELDLQVGVGGPELVDGGDGTVTLRLDEIAERPRSEFFEAVDFVTAIHKCLDQAAEEVGVAVVPIGH
ncbi:MAG: hypothetical protein NVS9B15_06990 [Acidobacteriaceae bacterium]